MTSRAWLLALGLLAFAVLAGLANQWAFTFGLICAAVLVWWADQYLKRPTSVPTAPESLRCVGCRQRDRKIKWRNLWLGAAVVGVLVAFYLGTLPGRPS